jgi:hypothetical protein
VQTPRRSYGVGRPPFPRTAHRTAQQHALATMLSSQNAYAEWYKDDPLLSIEPLRHTLATFAMCALHVHVHQQPAIGGCRVVGLASRATPLSNQQTLART